MTSYFWHAQQTETGRAKDSPRQPRRNAETHFARICVSWQKEKRIGSRKQGVYHAESTRILARLKRFFSGNAPEEQRPGPYSNSADATAVRSFRRIVDQCDHAAPRNPGKPFLGDGRWDSLCRLVLWRLFPELNTSIPFHFIPDYFNGGPPPEPAEDVDVAVVGGGLSGLASAYLLRQHNTVPSGIARSLRRQRAGRNVARDRLLVRRGVFYYPGSGLIPGGFLP